VDNWIPVTQKPEKSGNYLVALREDNSIEFNHKEPIIAQFGYLKQYPENWSAYDQFMCTHTIIDCDVLWWMELPEVPKNPPFNVWIDWHYTKENPWPKLDGDPLIFVKAANGGDTTKRPPRRFSYWRGSPKKEGTTSFNSFEWEDENNPCDDEIIAYMLVDPNDHD